MNSFSRARRMVASRHAAFTLIELLTVIAIIGVLAAIIIPVSGKVRLTAATASDTSNLRQIGQGIQLHVADQKGQMPNSYTAPIPGVPVNATTGRADWNFPEAVDRYFGPAPRFQETSTYNFTRRGSMWFSQFAEVFDGFAPNTPDQKLPVAYGYNPYVEHTNWRSMGNVSNPSKIVIMGEATEAGGYKMFRAMSGQSGYDATMTTDGAMRSTYRVNRSGKSLYLFCDGHVELLEGNLSEPALAAAGKQNIWKWWQ